MAKKVVTRKKKHPNVGSSLEDFLREEGIAEAAMAIAFKRVIAWQLKQAMSERRLTKTAMAARMDTTRAQLDRVLNPKEGNVTLATLQRAATAVGRKLRLELA